MPDSEPAVRHVWVDVIGRRQNPGLLMAWRRNPDGQWEAQVAIVGDASVLVRWVPRLELHPVTDPRWDRTR